MIEKWFWNECDHRKFSHETKKIENLLQDTLHCNCLSFIHGNHHQGDYILLKDKIMNDEHWWKNKTKKLVVYYNEHDDDDRLFQNGHHSFIKKNYFAK